MDEEKQLLTSPKMIREAMQTGYVFATFEKFPHREFVVRDVRPAHSGPRFVVLVAEGWLAPTEVYTQEREARV